MQPGSEWDREGCACGRPECRSRCASRSDLHGPALHEFRNHLSLMLAISAEIRGRLPKARPSVVADAIRVLETSVYENALFSTAYGVLGRPSRPAKTRLIDVVAQARVLAGPGLSSAEIVVDSSGSLWLPNPAGALHCALACIFVDLRRLAEQSCTACLRISVRGRDDAHVELRATPFRMSPPASWQAELVRALLLKAGALRQYEADRLAIAFETTDVAVSGD